MDLKPGDVIWIAWPRERGAVGRVVDPSAPADEVLVGRDGQWHRIDGHVREVVVTEKGQKARLRMSSGSNDLIVVADCRERNESGGNWHGVVEDVRTLS